VSVVILGLGLFLSSPLRASSVPAEATAAAQGFLDHEVSKAQSDSTWFWRRWEKAPVNNPSDLRLGTPYEIYAIVDSALKDLAGGGELNSPKYLDGYGFPVYEESTFVGTIMAGKLDGVWRFTGVGFFNSYIENRILRVQKKYRGQSDYRVSMVSSKRLGMFIVVIYKEDIVLIAPAIDLAGYMLSIPPPAGDDYPLIDYDEIKPRLMKKAEELHGKFAGGSSR